MTEELGSWATGLLVDEAWAAYRDGDYQHALSAAEHATELAEQLDDAVQLVRALSVEARTLRITGDYAAALVRYTRIMALAEDPATGSRLDHPRAAEAVADAHWSWVESARFMTGIRVEELLRVLDAADRWLIATGHRDWRAGIISERATIYQQLGDQDAAFAAAEEALAVAIQHPDAPGCTINTHRLRFADILLGAGHAADAEPQYRTILADPAATPWERRAAHTGLASCALAAGDSGTAQREARTAVSLAEQLGDDTLCSSLEVLTQAYRADGDSGAAWQAATRFLEVAGRIGGHYWPYFATRLAADVALNRGDLPNGRRLMTELDEHASALDVSTGTTTYTSEAAERRRRLTDLEDVTA